jgi:hypothetical protein
MAHHTNGLSPRHQNPTGLPTAPTVQRTGDRSPLAATIAERACAKCESRGHVDGFDLEDLDRRNAGAHRRGVRALQQPKS